MNAGEIRVVSDLPFIRLQTGVNGTLWKWRNERLLKPLSPRECISSSVGTIMSYEPVLKLKISLRKRTKLTFFRPVSASPDWSPLLSFCTDG